MLWIVLWQLVKRCSVCRCHNQLCTRICAHAMIGLLKGHFRFANEVEKKFWHPFLVIFWDHWIQGYLYTIWELDYVCAAGSVATRKSWRQFLNDVNDAYDHQSTLFLQNYVCTIPVFSWMINGGNNLREDDDLREAIILNISHLKSNKLNMGFLTVPNLVPW